MTQLRKDHAEIRYSTLLIINELFCRSAVFRSKLQLDFEEFLELVEGTNPEKPLPLPAVCIGMFMQSFRILKIVFISKSTGVSVTKILLSVFK